MPPGDTLIDWLAVLQELRALGLSTRAIAQSIGVPLGTVDYWMQGYCPLDMRYTRAVRLLALLESTRAGAVSIPKPDGDRHG